MMPHCPHPLLRPVTLRPVDLVLTASCAAASLWLLSPAARWAPGAGRSAAAFALFALGPPLLRWLQACRPAWRLPGLLATFWLLPVAGLGHSLLNPVVDAVGHRLYDPELARLDLHLLGAAASAWTQTRVTPWLTELLLVCYYGHFVWPVVLGLVLHRRADHRPCDAYQLAVALFLAANYCLYALVPAIGPRFFLAHAFGGALQGGWLTPRLQSLMLYPAFLRDCFPSGHTGIALLVLFFSWRHAPRLFRIALLPCLGLIAATVVGRFHYAVDLAAALPLVCAVAAGVEALYRRAPQAAAPEVQVQPVAAQR